MALTRKVIDQYAVSDVDPHLLRRVTGWSTREVPSKLERALSQPARADRPRYSAEGNEDVRDGAPNVRYRMYPAGNVRDEQTGQLCRRGDMAYLSSPVPRLVLGDPVRGARPTRLASRNRPQSKHFQRRSRGPVNPLPHHRALRGPQSVWKRLDGPPRWTRHQLGIVGGLTELATCTIGTMVPSA